MKNTQTHLFDLKLKRNFNLFSHSLFFFTFSSFKVGFSTGKKRKILYLKNIIIITIPDRPNFEIIN